MKAFFKVGNYEQSYDLLTKEITCTCMHTTMEISRYPNDYKKRSSCKHIKQLIKWIK